MQVTIDNLSGSGPVNYTGSIAAAGSVSLVRQLNAPSECKFSFFPDAQGLPVPLRYARVSVADATGLVLFTGYVATVPAMLLAGNGLMGASYYAQVTAISDELLLDSVLSVKSGTTLNQPLNQSLQTLARLTGSSSITLSSQT